MGQLATHPDLSFSVSLLARFQANPGIKHWKALMHVVGYIKNTLAAMTSIHPLLLMQTMGDVETPVALLPGTYSLWPEEPLPGVVNDRQL